MEEAIERMVREATASANAEIEEEFKELQNSLCPNLLLWLKTLVNTSASPVAATEQENTAPSNSNSATDEENTAPSNSNSATEEENSSLCRFARYSAPPVDSLSPAPPSFQPLWRVHY